MNDTKRTRVACLIDADNASPRHAEAIFAEIAKLGEATVRRIYGEFSAQGLKGWNDQLSRYALVPVHTVAYTKQKNASDIALVIDAMDLIHSGLYDAFCIVSSDSDFTRLAQRLRELGAEVYGIGERKTPESFRNSCRRFFFVENLARDQAAEAAPEPELALPGDSVLPASDALPVINRAFERHRGDHADGWVAIRSMQRTIANVTPDFDVRSYGEHRLGDLAVKTGAYEIKQIKDHGWWLRAKNHATQRQGGQRTPSPPSRKPAPTGIDPDRLPRPVTTGGGTRNQTATRGGTTKPPARPAPKANATARPRRVRRTGATKTGD